MHSVGEDPAGGLLTKMKVKSLSNEYKHRGRNSSCPSDLQCWARHSITAEAVAKAPSRLTRLLKLFFLLSSHVVAYAYPPRFWDRRIVSAVSREGPTFRAQLAP